MVLERLSCIGVLVAFSLSALGAAAQDLVYVGSNGEIVFVDSADPGRFGQPEVPTRALRGAGLSFNVAYDDVTTNTGFGFDDPAEGALRQATVEAVLTYIATVLNVTTGATVDIRFDVSETDGTDFLAAGGPLFLVSDTTAYSNGAVFDHITTGSDPNPFVVDMSVIVDFGFDWQSDHNQPPDPTETDLFSVMLHEITHGLGILSLSDMDGKSAVTGDTPGVYTVWDKLMRFDDAGVKEAIWKQDDPNQTLLQQAASVFTSDNLFMSGTNATEAFGSEPPVYAPSPFEDASSLSHFKTGAVDAVMEHAIFVGTMERSYTAVDIGALLDIGYASAVAPTLNWSPPSALNSNAASDEGDDYEPQLTTDGAGTWIAVWDSLDSLGGTIGTDYDILYAVSTNAGATWSAPAALNSNAASDTGYDYLPQVTTDGAGTWIAVWDSNETLGGTIGADRDILYAVSTDAGATWSAPAALNSNAASDNAEDFPAQLTTDGVGTWIAVWYSSDSLGGTIGTDFDVLYAVSTDDGATWGAPSALNSNANTDTGDDFWPQLTTDGLGTWIATWYSSESLGGTIGMDFDIFYAVSTNNGGTWSGSAALNSNAASDFEDDLDPQLTTDGAGTWIAVWYSCFILGAAEGDIKYAVSTDNGASWGPVAALYDNAGPDSGGDFFPQLTTDGAGMWIATWFSTDTLGDTIGVDFDILYAVSTDEGTSWSAPAALNGNAATDHGSDFFPQLTTDGAGTWIAAWHSSDSLSGTIDFDNDILYAIFAAPLTALAEVWVDFAWTGIERGTLDEPFSTLSQGVEAVSEGGIIHIKGGQSDETLTIDKAVRLEAFDGIAVIGLSVSRLVGRSGFMSRASGG